MPNDLFVFRVVVVTLATIVVAIVGALLIGLFHVEVDNKEVLAIIGPAFQVTIGAFVAVISRGKGDK